MNNAWMRDFTDPGDGRYIPTNPPHPPPRAPIAPKFCMHYDPRGARWFAPSAPSTIEESPPRHDHPAMR
jgi:hypothetical protein